MGHAGRDAKRGALYTMLAAGATCPARSGSETPRQHARLRIAALKAYGAAVSALRRKGLRFAGAARLGYLTETTASASNASHALAEWEEKMREIGHFVGGKPVSGTSGRSGDVFN